MACEGNKTIWLTSFVVKHKGWFVWMPSWVMVVMGCSPYHKTVVWGNTIMVVVSDGIHQATRCKWMYGQSDEQLLSKVWMLYNWERMCMRAPSMVAHTHGTWMYDKLSTIIRHFCQGCRPDLSTLEWMDQVGLLICCWRWESRMFRVHKVELCGALDNKTR